MMPPFRAGRVACVVLGVWLGAAAIRAGLPPGWRYAGHLPTGANLHAVWVAATNRVFVGGGGGTILQWDGGQWSEMETPTQKDIYDIHGTSPTDVWAVGGDPYTTDPSNRCVILHYNGAAWSERAAPTYVGWTYPLAKVHAIAPDDAWAIPLAGTVAAHWNGAAWSLAVPDYGAEGRFYDVSAADANHVFIVGSHGQILHRTGGAWVMERKTETGPASADLVQCVWADAAFNVVAANNAFDLLRREANGTWTVLNLSATVNNHSIWGRSATEIYTIGSRGVRRVNPSTGAESSYVYDGAMRGSWQSAHGADNLMFAVGANGVIHELRIEGDGAVKLSSLAVGKDANLYYRILGATAYGADRLLVYGDSYLNGGTTPMHVVDDTGAYPVEPRPADMLQNSKARAMLAAGPDDVYLSWDNVGAPYKMGLHRRVAGVWIEVLNPFGGPVVNIDRFWRSPAGTLYGMTPWQIWRIGADNVGTRIYQLEPPLQGAVGFSSMAGFSDAEIYLGANDGRIFRFDGSTLAEETTPGGTRVDFLAVYGGDIYAAGEGGKAWRRSAGAWTPMAGVETNAGEHFTGMATGSNAVYAVQNAAIGQAAGARVWRFSGASAEQMVRGVPGPPRGMAATGDGHLHIIDGYQVHLTTAPRPPVLAMQRLSGETNRWQVLGNTGVALGVAGEVGERDMVAAWRVDREQRHLYDEVTGAGYTTLKKEWVVRDDVWTNGNAVTNAKLQIEFEEDDVPDDFVPAAPQLYKITGDDWISWVPFETYVEWQFKKAQTKMPVSGFSAWTIAVPWPHIDIRSQGGSGHRLVWPLSASNFVLQTAERLTSGPWTAVPGTPDARSNRLEQTVAPETGSRFFRLLRR